jgi:cholesterol transport system auxiliary component
MTSAPSSPLPGRRQLLLGSAAVLLSGCALLNRPAPPQLYVLRPQMTPAMGAAVRWRLSIAAPETAASLDTERIALTRTPISMDYFANAAWTDRLPLMVQRVLLQGFEGTGRIMSVDREILGAANDYLLETEIRDFQARYDMPNAAPDIIIGIDVKLLQMPLRDIVSGTYISQETKASGNTIDSIVTAFNQATGAAISQIVGWTLNQPAPSAG